ncbi:MAG: hypothetical protein HKN03_09340 [Acidimicrobiales bacterium]|nr:hypothetical protein [Acidimicrobiales bacterium]
MITLPVLGVLAPALVSRPTRHSILRGIMVFRWLTVSWAVAIFLYELYDRNGRDLGKAHVERPVEGILLCIGLVLFVTCLTAAYLGDADRILRPPWILSEIAVATVLFLADVWVYGSPDHSQALPTVYPVAIIATVALTAGQRAAVLTGIGFGLARYVGWLPYNDTPWSLTRTSSLVLMAVAGWTSAYLFKRLELADRQISSFRAREEVALTLHDGVLQTLAVIQRRSEDEELVALARKQEVELRNYLFAGVAAPNDLATELRQVAQDAEAMYGFKAQVICAPDLPSGSPEQTTTLIGAVREALHNAGKHSKASEVTVYSEPDFADESTIFVSVKDNGVGFDPALVRRGQGLENSIGARLSEAGGASKIDGRPGRGTEVQLWL